MTDYNPLLNRVIRAHKDHPMGVETSFDACMDLFSQMVKDIVQLQKQAADGDLEHQHRWETLFEIGAGETDPPQSLDLRCSECAETYYFTRVAL